MPLFQIYFVLDLYAKRSVFSTLVIGRDIDQRLLITASFHLLLLSILRSLFCYLINFFSLDTLLVGKVSEFFHIHKNCLDAVSFLLFVSILRPRYLCL